MFRKAYFMYYFCSFGKSQGIGIHLLPIHFYYMDTKSMGIGIVRLPTFFCRRKNVKQGRIDKRVSNHYFW